MERLGPPQHQTHGCDLRHCREAHAGVRLAAGRQAAVGCTGRQRDVCLRGLAPVGKRGRIAGTRRRGLSAGVAQSRSRLVASTSREFRSCRSASICASSLPTKRTSRSHAAPRYRNLPDASSLFPRNCLATSRPPPCRRIQRRPDLLSPTITDIPAHYRDARAVHICPLDFVTQHQMISTFKASQVTTLTLDPSPGYMTPGIPPGPAHRPGIAHGLPAFRGEVTRPVLGSDL